MRRRAPLQDRQTKTLKLDAERIELVIALSDNVEQTRSTIFDCRGCARAVLTGVDAGIGKERSGLDAASPVGEQLRTSAA